MSIKNNQHPQYLTLETDPHISYKNISKRNNKEKSNSIKSYCSLPPIDHCIKKFESQESNSLLNKFIIKHAKKAINETKKELKNTLIIQNKFINDSHLLSKSHKKIKSEEQNLFNKKIMFGQYKKLNKNSIGLLLNNNTSKNQKINISNIFKKKELNNDIDTDKSTISENNDININDLYDKYNDENINKKKSVIISLEINSKISKDSKKDLLSKNFKRICTFQPDIILNWKYKYGLKLNLGDPSDYKIANKDINYQCKIIDNNYKLLIDDINYYKNKIMKNYNYFPSFENLSLFQKINYNKSLEEAIGILFILPKLLLNDFYKLIQNSYGITNFVKIEKLKEKYVIDENKNLKDNNKLFFEVIDYFKDCYKIFLVVVKEFENILIKPNDFSKIVSCLEKARFNMSYINNSSENALDLYKKDLDIINKFKGNNNKSIKNLSEKLRENYSFKNNKEKQIKTRINNSLTDRDDNKNDNIRNQKTNSPYKNITIKSIFNSKMMTDIMKHCREDSKLKISTERINNRLDGDDLDKIKSLPPVIKINI